MSSKDIRPCPVDMRSLTLSPEEGFVLSRVEGPTDVKELVALTGLDEGRVETIIANLVAQGALEREGTEAVASDAGESVEDDGEHEHEHEHDYRKIYERDYHPLSREERIGAAERVEGAALCALCLDPEPQVIHAICSNARVGLEHARLIAQHHRTQVGLETVSKRADFLADAWVQRWLLRNPQLPPTILGRLANPKMMSEVYKIAIDREIPERSRVLTREILRKKFMLSSSDERAALLAKTEGRCLVLLVNCSLDAHATQILCGKSTFSVLFVQNLARWSATPPALISHLLNNPLVKRNPGLRKLLLKHPNTPSSAKRE